MIAFFMMIKTIWFINASYTFVHYDQRVFVPPVFRCEGFTFVC